MRLTSLILLVLTSVTHAQLTYQFEVERTGEVLATVEMPSLPVSDAELLTFTLLDPVVDGYLGVPFSDIELELVGEIIADGRNGLAGIGPEFFEEEATVHFFLDPAASEGFPSWAPGNDEWHFAFRTEPGRDLIFEWLSDSSASNLGDWVLVPEPSCFPLAMVAIAALVSVARTRPTLAIR